MVKLKIFLHAGQPEHSRALPRKKIGRTRSAQAEQLARHFPQQRRDYIFSRQPGDRPQANGESPKIMLSLISWTTFAIWSAIKGVIVLALVFGFAALAAYLIVRHDLRYS